MIQIEEHKAEGTPCPWYIRTAEFDGKAVILLDHDIYEQQDVGLHLTRPERFLVEWNYLPWIECFGPSCPYFHLSSSEQDGELIIATDDEAEALAAFYEAEEKLIRGEL